MFWRTKNGWNLNRRLQLRSARQPFTNTRWPQFECLECRAVLSATAVFSLGTLTVTGTAGNDFFNIAAVAGKVQVTANGQVISNSTPLSAVTTIAVNGLDGSDLLTVRGINKHVVFDGGSGADQDQLTVVGVATHNDFSLLPTTSTLMVNGFAYEFSNIDRLTANGQGANDSFAILGPAAFPVVFNGGAGSDTLQGPNIANTWALNVVNGGVLNGNVQFGGMENLTGGSDVDTFVMNPGASISSVINGGGGNDVITYASRSTPISVDPRVSSATGVGRYVSIETIAGSSANNTIVGPNRINNWVISGVNVVTLNGLTFSGVENVTGNKQADIFNFTNGGYLTGKIDGKAGSNSLNFNGDTGTNSINLATGAYTNAAHAGAFINVGSFVGSASGATTLIAPDETNTWSINGSNQGNVAGDSFTQIPNLTGGAQNDTFIFANGTGVAGTVNGGGGTDVLDYSRYTTAHTIDLNKVANMETLIGGSGIDTLIGPNVVTTWNITGANVGNVNGTLSFSKIENLVGGNKDDIFAIAVGASWSGNIDGGSETGTFNELDYSAFTTSVHVDLTAHTATSVGGTVTHITDVLGGSAADTLIGDAGDNFLSGNGGNDVIEGGGGNDILLGGAGDDTITAGDGRDLLFGGLGADTLSGGGGEDILFNGTTSFDANGATLDAIHTYWKRLDLDFATRVAQLKAGTTGVTDANGNPIPALNSTTVVDDTTTDTLTGGDGLDWFFAKTTDPGLDVISDFMTGEQLN
jgi:Ca2+-binding RTX toxin-like protein